MKKEKTKKSPPQPDEDLAIIQRKILDDLLEREKLRKEVEENPSDEKQNRIERLTETIEENQRISGASFFSGTLEAIDKLAEQLVNIFPNQNEEELLRLGDDAFVVQALQNIIRVRNDFDDYGRHFLPVADAIKVLERFDDLIAQAKQIIEEKRKSAVKNFPELARSVREPDFEMSEYYKETLNNIMQMAEKRKELAKNLKYVAPNKRKEYLAALAEMDRLINEAEQFLAERYEAHQKKQRWLNGLRKMFKEASQAELHSMREHLKANPGKNPDIEKLMAEEFPE
jgi:hypothetical protein